MKNENKMKATSVLCLSQNYDNLDDQLSTSAQSNTPLFKPFTQ